jgi:hypothetical protein
MNVAGSDAASVGNPLFPFCKCQKHRRVCTEMSVPDLIASSEKTIGALNQTTHLAWKSHFDGMQVPKSPPTETRIRFGLRFRPVEKYLEETPKAIELPIGNKMPDNPGKICFVWNGGQKSRRETLPFENMLKGVRLKIRAKIRRSEHGRDADTFPHLVFVGIAC